MSSLSRTPPSSGTSQTSPENKVRQGDTPSTASERKTTTTAPLCALCILLSSPGPSLSSQPFHLINDPHLWTFSVSSSSCFFPLSMFTPSLLLSAINLLKDREPGAFIIRDSHSFRGAYGLAMKVACPPPTVQQNKKGNKVLF